MSNRKQRRAALKQSSAGNRDPRALFVEAKSLHERGDLKRARQLYSRFLATTPGDPEANFLFGALLLQTGDPDMACRHLKLAAEAAPAVPQVWMQLAVALEQTGMQADAEAAHRQAIDLSPGNPEAFNNFAAFLKDTGRVDDALPLFEKAVALSQGNPVFLANLGSAQMATDNLPDAIETLRKAHALMPGDAQTAADLSDALVMADEGQDVCAPLKSVLKNLRSLPKTPEREVEIRRTLTKLTASYLAQDNMGAAANLLTNTVDGWQDDAQLTSNLGLICLRTGQIEQALRYYRLALKAAPHDAEIWGNFANCLAQANDWGEAGEAYRKAFECDPDAPRHRFQYALYLLRHGKLKETWPLYESGFACGQRAPALPEGIPQWKGGPLEGRTLTIVSEQGVGDVIYFASALPFFELPADGHIRFSVDPRLVSLFSRSFPHIEIIPQDKVRLSSTSDCVCPIGTVFGIVFHDAENLKWTSGFLKPDPERVHQMRSWLTEMTGGRRSVGLAWRSMGVRLTTLDQWKELILNPDLAVISLQYGPDAEKEIENFKNIHGAGPIVPSDLDLTDDFDGVAALIAALDRVANAGTSTAMLAGALGVPTINLIQGKSWAQLGTNGMPPLSSIKLISSPYGSFPEDSFKYAEKWATGQSHI